MRALLGIVLAVQVAPPSPAPAPGPAAPDAPEVVPHEGALEQGLSELEGLSEQGEHERALELAASLEASPELGRLDEARRARALHDVGLARARAQAVEEAVADLRAAAGLAGPGELRATSLFEAGTARLLHAEQLRLEVPEIAERLGVPSPPSAPPPPLPAGPPPGPDALELARNAYLAARAELLERLRLDWRDEDTRANLELALRRLRELEQIEREREQSPPQESPQDSQQEQPQEQPQGEPQEQPPQERPQDPQQEQPGEDEEQPPEPEETPESEEGEEGEEAGQPEPAREEERVLSREEVLRLLDQLERIDEQARAVRARLRESRRKPVEKDW